MKKAIVLLANGFEEIEALTQVDFLRRAGVAVTMMTIQDELVVTGAHGIGVVADQTFAADVAYDAIIIPGGLPGATNLQKDPRVISLVQAAHQDGKIVAAMCAGPVVLEEAGILAGQAATCYPGFEEHLPSADHQSDLVVVSGNIITSRGPATAILFGYAIVKALLGAEAEAALKAETLFPLLAAGIGV